MRKSSFIVFLLSVWMVLQVQAHPDNLKNDFYSGKPASVSSLQEQTIKGTVTDAKSGETLIGVTILEEGTTNGTTTDLDGKYSIKVSNPKAVLVFSFVGFNSERIAVENQTVIDVKLVPTMQNLDEVVVVAYGKQTKASLTGSIGSVNSKDLMTTKNQNIQNMITGKIAGVRVMQKTSEPGEFNGGLDIRGFGNPLYVVDGVPRGDMPRIDGLDIESISVLKDASAAVYGLRAANGVVLITTKKGTKGAPKMTYSGYYGIQVPAEILKPVGVLDRMTLMNEKDLRGSYGNPIFTYTDEDRQEYIDGTKKSTDWYDAILRNSAPQQQHNLSLSGGTDAVSYYVNLGYGSQQGFFKSNSLQYQRMNLRTNLDAKISKRLSFSLKLSGILDERDRPSQTTWNAFKALWRSLPDVPLYVNDDPNHLSYQAGTDVNNVLATTNSAISGYSKSKNKIIQTSAELNYDIPFVTGLTAKGMVAFDPRFSDGSNFVKSYNEYTYDQATEKYSAYQKNTSSLDRNYGYSQKFLYQLSLNYKRKFAEKHNLGLLALLESDRVKSDNFQASRNLTIPIDQLYSGDALYQVGTSDPEGITDYTSNGIVGRMNYDYAGKYLLEYSFRYDGSSRFPKEKQWGYFPNMQAGWRMSEEGFIKNNLNFVDNIKIRGSYGVLADDSDAAKLYAFISGYDYPNTSGYMHDNYPTGYMFDGVYTNVLGFRTPANMNLTWYTATTSNVGLDVDLWKGKFGFSFDVFKRKMEGLLGVRTGVLPKTLGTNMPQENLNSNQTAGFDVELRHKSKVGKLWIDVSGNMSLTRTKNLFIINENKSDYGNSYDYWRNAKQNRYNDIWFGYGENGVYQSFAEIQNSDVFTNYKTLPGDYKYEDWNNDGVIDDADYYPIATTTNPTKALQDKENEPLMFFGLNISLQYKGFDLNMLFQGAAMSYVSYGDQLIQPLQWNGNALEYLMDRWHPEVANVDPYDPNAQWVSGTYMYGANAGESNSRFLIQNGSYLRLKNIELGYTLPKNWLTKTGFKEARVYVNGYNLYTLTGVKTLDPEHPSELYGYMYPLNKTVNFGVNISF